jgi:hypothetical protein
VCVFILKTPWQNFVKNVKNKFPNLLQLFFTIILILISFILGFLLTIKNSNRDYMLQKNLEAIRPNIDKCLSQNGIWVWRFDTDNTVFGACMETFYTEEPTERL